MKNPVDIIQALRYKLCMFGNLTDGATYIFCDNRAVCVNATRPELTLSKKHHIIYYHREQEAFVELIVRVLKEHKLTNLSDLFTNTMVAPKREIILDKCTYQDANWGVWFSTLVRFSHKQSTYLNQK